MGWKEMLQDGSVSLGHGIVDAGEAAVGLGDLATGGMVGRGMAGLGYNPEMAHQLLNHYYSPNTRQAVQAVEAARGVGDTLAALYDNPAALGYGVVRQLPQAVGGAAVGRRIAPAVAKAGHKAAKKLAKMAGRTDIYKPGIGTGIAANAIGEGLIGAGAGAEEYRQEAPTAPWTGAQSVQALRRGVLDGITSAAAGIGLRRLPVRPGLRHPASEMIETPVGKLAEGDNRDRAHRDYVGTTDRRPGPADYAQIYSQLL